MAETQLIPLDLFRQYHPFHNIIHYYVDLSTFLITSGDDTVSPKVWWALNRRKRVTSLYSLEVQYGGPGARDRFTGQCFRKVRSSRSTLCAERLGFRDFFVPIPFHGRIQGYLQAGAFADREITLDMLVRCWKDLSGKDFSPDLPEFRSFAQAFLEIPVLEEPLFSAFREALELFAEFLSGGADPETAGGRLQQLQVEVFSKRLPHSYWMDWALGRPTSESVPPWSRRMEKWSWTKDEIGLTRVPTTVVAVIPRRIGPTSLNWAEETLKVYRFQRRSFLFGRTLSETVGGKLDDYGSVFVTSADPRLPALARKRVIEEAVRKIREFAIQELGGPILVGVGKTVLPGESLGDSYREAVLSLHLWKGEGKDVIFYEGGGTEKAPEGFAELQAVLDELDEAFATAAFSDLGALKERFLKLALGLFLQNPSEIRRHLQYVLDRLARTAAVRADLEKKEGRLLREELTRKMEHAATFQEIILTYQEALSRLEKEIERPFSAQRDQSVEKAREYLDRHFKEAVSLAKLSRKAGVSTATFSRRFKRLTGLGMGEYLQKRRLEEAKRLLKSTRLPVFRIARDCGFKSVPYFVHLFHEKNGLPPQAYRMNPENG
jgi:AraC-like DNA-binding protein